jgi:hypothetical protein
MNRAGLACITLICFAPLGAEVAGCTNRAPEGSELSSGESSPNAGSGTLSAVTSNTSLTGASGGTVATGTTGSGGTANAANSSQTSVTITTATSSITGGGGLGGSSTTDAQSATSGAGGRGPTPPSATAAFPFPQNRESPNCAYPSAYSNADVGRRSPRESPTAC